MSDPAAANLSLLPGEDLDPVNIFVVFVETCAHRLAQVGTAEAREAEAALAASLRTVADALNLAAAAMPATTVH